MYMLTSWLKIRPNVYDAGGKVVFIKQKFLTSVFSILIGANSLIVGIVYGLITYYTDRPEDKMIMLFLAAGPVAALGLFLLVKGIEGNRIRQESGGIHPTDTLYIIDGSSKELRRCVGNIEERLADFENLKMEIITIHGKNTSYSIQLAWADQKIRVASSGRKSDMEKLLADIQNRVGITPVITEQTN